MYPQAGEVIEGKYRVERMLGEGGMGAVFAATHLLRKAPVALKFMSPAAAAVPEAVDRFMNEAVAASEIQSDHVVKIFDVGRWNDTPYLVMEYLQGHDLAGEIEQQAKAQQLMSPSRAVHFVLQILRALQVAHAKGIVHRDLKPANAFIVTHEGEPDFVKLLDFGISKRAQEAGGVSLTRTNVAMGTPLYMAPEQARSARDADARSDLYSVAAILFELLANRPPLEADSYNMILFKLFQEEPPRIETLRADLPPGLADIVHHALAKDPNARYQNAAAFAEAIAPYAEARSQVVIGRILANTVGGAPRPSFALTPPGSMPGAAGGRTNAQAVGNTAVAFSPKTDAEVAVPAKSSRAPLFIGVALVAVLGVGGAAFALGKKSDAGSSGAASKAGEEAKASSAPVESAPKKSAGEVAPAASASANASAIAEAPSPVASTATSASAASAGAKSPAASTKPAVAAGEAPSTAVTGKTGGASTPPKKKLDWKLSE